MKVDEEDGNEDTEVNSNGTGDDYVDNDNDDDDHDYHAYDQENVQYTAKIDFPPVSFPGFIWARPLPRALYNIPWRTGVLNESERNRRRRVSNNSLSSYFRKHKIQPGNHHKIKKVESTLETITKYSWTSPQRPPWKQKKVAAVERF